MNKNLSHLEFLEKLLINNIHFRNKEFELISEYTKQSIPLLVKTKYGMCNSYSSTLLKGIIPTIQSAVDKTEYFKNIVKERNPQYEQGNFEIIGTYKPCEKILVVDKYSEHLMYPNSLIEGSVSPNILSSTNKELYTKNKLKEIHNEKYRYDKLKYTKRRSEVIITCPIHGDFKQCLHDHYRGEGCYDCGREKSTLYIKEHTTGWNIENWILQAKKSKNFDSFKVYVIRCWNENEDFFKIGRTFSKITKRFPNKTSMPYEYEIIDTFIGDPITIWEKEKYLKKINKKYKYSPVNTFNGKEECYNKIVYEG